MLFGIVVLFVIEVFFLCGSHLEFANKQTFDKVKNKYLDKDQKFVVLEDFDEQCIFRTGYEIATKFSLVDVEDLFEVIPYHRPYDPQEGCNSNNVFITYDTDLGIDEFIDFLIYYMKCCVEC